MQRLSMEKVVGNAFIVSLNQGDDSKFLSYNQIEDYGYKVCEILQSQGKRIYFYMNRFDIHDMLFEYPYYFEEGSKDNELGVKLRDFITESELENAFCNDIALDVAVAFECDEAVNILHNRGMSI